jgi:hypothetical protein
MPAKALGGMAFDGAGSLFELLSRSIRCT